MPYGTPGIAPTGMSSLASSVPTSGTSSLSSSLSNFEPSYPQQPQPQAMDKRSQVEITPRTPRQVSRVSKPTRTPIEPKASSPEKMAVREIIVHPLHHHRHISSSPVTAYSPSPTQGRVSGAPPEAEKIKKLEFIARSEQEGRIHLERKLEEAKTVHGQLHAQLEDVKQALAAQHADAVDKQILIQQEIQRWAGEFEDLRTLVILGNQAQTKMQDELDHYKHTVRCREAEIEELRQDLADRDRGLQKPGTENESLCDALGGRDASGGWGRRARCFPCCRQ